MKLIIEVADEWADDVSDAGLLPDGLRNLLDAIGTDVTDRDHDLVEHSTITESTRNGERTMGTYWLEPERPVEGPTFRFYLGGHLTFITDAEGAVVGLEIQPYQETPTQNDYQEDGTPEIDWDALGEKANDNGWHFSALQHLPAGITWEV